MSAHFMRPEQMRSLSSRMFSERKSVCWSLVPSSFSFPTKGKCRPISVASTEASRTCRKSGGARGIERKRWNGVSDQLLRAF